MFDRAFHWLLHEGSSENPRGIVTRRSVAFHLAAFSDQFVQALHLGILGMDARGQQVLLAEFTIVAGSPVVAEGFPD